MNFKILSNPTLPQFSLSVMWGQKPSAAGQQWEMLGKVLWIPPGSGLTMTGGTPAGLTAAELGFTGELCRNSLCRVIDVHSL